MSFHWRDLGLHVLHHELPGGDLGVLHFHHYLLKVCQKGFHGNKRELKDYIFVLSPFQAWILSHSIFKRLE